MDGGQESCPAPGLFRKRARAQGELAGSIFLGEQQGKVHSSLTIRYAAVHWRGGGVLEGTLELER